MTVIALTILAILFVWLFNQWRLRAFSKLAFQLPSNRLHTWLGCGPILLRSKDAEAYLLNHVKKFGSESVGWLGPFPIYVTFKPETVKDVLIPKNMIHKPLILYKGLESVLDPGLITISDAAWSRRRKIFNKAFMISNIMGLTSIFHEEVINTLNSIEKSLKSGEFIDLLLVFQALTVRTSAKTIFRKKFESTGYSDIGIARQCSSVLLYAAERCSNQLLKINFVRYLAHCTIYRKAREAQKILSGYFREAISEYDNSYLPDIVSPIDVGLTAEKQNLLAREEMEGDIKNLFAAAFETSSSTLYLVICMLAMHHEYQERAYKEITSLLPDFSKDDKIMFDQINQLVYLDMVLNETMRLFPPVPMIFRTVTNENLKLTNGLTLPVGQIVCIDICSLHRNKDMWGPQADRFNPENFSPTNVEQRHPYAFIPFAKGPRVCIGYRYALLFIKISLVELIRNYKFDTEFKYENLQIEALVTLHLTENPKIKIERRMP